MPNDIFFIAEDENPFNGKVKIFYYTEINVEDSGYKYPVYVSFLDDTVYFRYFGYVNNNDGNNSFGEYTLFKLHLNTSPATQKKLDETVISLYDNSFPLMSDYHIPQRDTHNLGTPIRNYKTYKDLKCFSDTQNDERNTIEGNEHTRKIFYKDLLLDFLYTVNKHPEIFNSDKAFDKIKHLLNDAPILQAISAKAEYYFYKENYIENRLFFNVFQNNKNQNIKNFQNALNHWLSILQKTDSYNLIKGKSWFNDVETETRKVLTDMPVIKEIDNSENRSEIDKTNKFINKFNLNLFKKKEKSLEWFISRNNILRAWFVFDKFKLIFFILLILILYFVTNTIFTISFKNTPIFDTNKLVFFLTLTLIYYIKYIKRYIAYLLTFRQFSLEKTLKLIIKFISNISKLFMFRLWWLMAGASYFVFEISSFYNKHFIENDWTYQIGFVLLFLLIAIIIYKFYFSKVKANHSKSDIILVLKLFVLTSITTGIIYYMLGKFWLGLTYDKDLILPHHRKTKMFFFFAIISTFFILFNNDKKFHPNLDNSTTINKTFSMFFYGIVISFFINIGLYHTFYKEYLEKYEHLGRMWEQATYYINDEDIEEKNNDNNPSNPDSNNEHKNKCTESNKNGHGSNKEYTYVYTGDKNMFENIKEKSCETFSDEVKVYIDEHFYDELVNLYVYKQVKLEETHQENNHNSDTKVAQKETTKNTEKDVKHPKLKKLFPVLKKVNIMGFKDIYIIPSVLFINTFLTLFVASFFQFLLHRKRFMEGGELE